MLDMDSNWIASSRSLRQLKVPCGLLCRQLSRRTSKQVSSNSSMSVLATIAQWYVVFGDSQKNL